MTKEEIYKTYKHGGNLKYIPIKKVYNALKENKLQPIIVWSNDKFGKRRKLFNYNPDTNKFEFLGNDFFKIVRYTGEGPKIKVRKIKNPGL